MKTHECQQGDDRWWELRRGRPTASSFHRIITPKKWEYASGAASYIHQLVAEKYVPPFRNDFATCAMRNGSLMEPEARRYYEFYRDAQVEQVGFLTTNDERFGCSPDSLVGDDGGLEIKSPEPTTQVKWLVSGGVPAEHLAQCHGFLFVSGRAWIDFMSYCPPLPELLVRVEPDEKTDSLRDALEKFWAEYQAALVEVEGLFQPEPTKTVTFGSMSIEVGPLPEIPF